MAEFLANNFISPRHTVARTGEFLGYGGSPERSHRQFHAPVARGSTGKTGAHGPTCGEEEGPPHPHTHIPAKKRTRRRCFEAMGNHIGKTFRYRYRISPQKAANLDTAYRLSQSIFFRYRASITQPCVV